MDKHNGRAIGLGGCIVPANALLLPISVEFFIFLHNQFNPGADHMVGLAILGKRNKQTGAAGRPAGIGVRSFFGCLLVDLAIKFNK
ncbi:hypothetical protein [Mucilaginibacter sp. OK098]|uniref:hypothetical protein n=1 Tax=Mucilaginibacter sp. OK098 TaxID=1855297 RepID=UPI001356321E|nr:hypothetical protein [Mucilaginibacter sp. OK098]